MVLSTPALGSCALPILPAPLESCVLASQPDLLPNLLTIILVTVTTLVHYFINSKI